MDNKEAKKLLTQAYQIIAYLGLDDHTYNHLSIRSPEDPDTFFIHRFNLRFEEVTEKDLLQVNMEGTVLNDPSATYNKTGFYLHGVIYKHRPDINAIFHVHTPEIVAVSALKDGLLPISQWALHFYNRLAYYEYDSLTLDERQGNDLVRDLSDKYTILLRNHGVITTGRDIQEAMLYLYHLYMACKTQCLTLSMGTSYLIPTKEVCEQAAHDLLTFEDTLGHRDWNAWIRTIERRKS